MHILLLASQVGALGLLGKWQGDRFAPPILKKLPPAIRPLYLAVGFQPKYFRSSLDESAAGAQSDHQVSRTGPLGDLPLTVIRHGIPDLFARMPAEQARLAEQVWQELQMDLAGQSSNSRMLVAELSGHAIQIEQPDLVVDAIRDMIMAFRKVSAFE